MVAAFTICSLQTAKADGYYNGKNVKQAFPRGVDSSRVTTDASYKYRDLAYDDTLLISVTDLQTYVKCDTMSGDAYAIVTVNAYVYPGAELWLRFGNNDTLRTVYLKQGATVIDTILVGDKNTTRSYLYTNNGWTKSSSFIYPQYVAAVTQATSITTGVTINADAGVITTVSSTIAADDSSASFTVTNSFIKPTSVIQLTAGTAGNGRPMPQITSQTTGSMVIRLYNAHRTAALNNTVKIHFAILNK